MVLIGILGFGKLIILKMINWFIEYDEGEIYFVGEEICNYKFEDICCCMGYVI